MARLTVLRRSGGCFRLEAFPDRLASQVNLFFDFRSIGDHPELNGSVSMRISGPQSPLAM